MVAAIRSARKEAFSRAVRATVFALGAVALALLPASRASAQSAGGAPPGDAPPPPSPPAAAPSDATSAAAPAAPAPTVREATGYAPSSIPSAAGGSTGAGGTKKKSGTKKASAPKAERRAQKGAFVVEPGFEVLDSGGSRFYVELGQAVPVEARKAKGSVTFVLKGAHNAFRNNENPLVTEHFNTPVRRARLKRSGRDVLFVMEMRQDAAETHRVVTNEEGHAVLQVDFGAGSFVKGAAAPVPASPDANGDDADGNDTDGAASAPNAAPAPAKGAGPKP